MRGEGVDMESIRKVARVTNHSLPYLVAAAYGIPMEEVADGIGDVLPYDHRINRESREHLTNQYRLLSKLPPDPNDEAEPS